MSTLEIIFIIALPIIYLIGRYRRFAILKEFKVEYEKSKELHTQLVRQHQDRHERLCERFDTLEAKYLQYQLKAPKFQIVANTKKHPAANDNYLYIEGTINGQREAGLLRLKQWDEAKATLLKNPEDKPQ